MKREAPPNLKLLHEILSKLEQLDKQIKSLNQDVKEIKHYQTQKKMEDEKLKRAEQTETGWFVWS
jgi:TolA-binding protein